MIANLETTSNNMQKRVFGHMWTAKAQIACICGQRRPRLPAFVDSEDPDCLHLWTAKAQVACICGQRRPRSLAFVGSEGPDRLHVWTAKAQIACISGKSHQNLHFPLTESLDATECMNRVQRLGGYFAHAPDGLNQRILCMLECTLLLDAVNISICEQQSRSNMFSYETIFVWFRELYSYHFSLGMQFDVKFSTLWRHEFANIITIWKLRNYCVI